MPTTRRSRTIAAPPEDVWTVVGDPTTCRAGGRESRGWRASRRTPSRWCSAPTRGAACAPTTACSCPRRRGCAAGPGGRRHAVRGHPRRLPHRREAGAGGRGHAGDDRGAPEAARASRGSGACSSAGRRGDSSTRRSTAWRPWLAADRARWWGWGEPPPGAWAAAGRRGRCCAPISGWTSRTRAAAVAPGRGHAAGGGASRGCPRPPRGAGGGRGRAHDRAERVLRAAGKSYPDLVRQRAGDCRPRRTPSCSPGRHAAGRGGAGGVRRRGRRGGPVRRRHERRRRASSRCAAPSRR